MKKSTNVNAWVLLGIPQHPHCSSGRLRFKSCIDIILSIKFAALAAVAKLVDALL